LEFTGEECIPPGAFHRSTHLLRLLVERASRCYEFCPLALVAFL